MADAPEGHDSSKEAPLLTFPLELARDFLLDLIVGSVEKSESPFPITLVVGGSVVAGDIISLRRYTDLYWASLTPAGHETPPNPFQGEAATDGSGVFIGRYLHLENAAVVSASGTLPTNSSMLVRIRLSDVQGFGIGKMSAIRG